MVDRRGQADDFFEQWWHLPRVGAGEALWPRADGRESTDWPLLDRPGEASDEAWDEWWDESAPDSPQVDERAAVLPFGDEQRRRMEPLLDATETTTAMQWNASKHPTDSGIDPSRLREALARYVDFDAVTQTVASSSLPSGNPPFDAVMVQAIGQFQRKCFFEARWQHGKADGPTLDSLGFVHRRGLRSSRRVNRKAKSRLQRAPVARLSGDEFTADTWFHYILNPSFLGWTFVVGGQRSTGIHLYMVRKLRVAERWLMEHRGLQGSTPIELARAVGFSETNEIHRGYRPGASSKSFHTFGLAMDVQYRTNPFITGSAFTAVIKRAVKLVSGGELPGRTINVYLNRLGTNPDLSTGEIYDRIAGHNADFVRYIGLTKNAEADELRQLLQARREAGTSGVFRRGESVDAAVTRWRRQIKADRRAMKNPRNAFGTNGGGIRDIDRGFLNQDRDLVIALRDHGCLAWGACDLGSGGQGSGDVMHFDARVCGLGGRLPSGGQRRVRKGHPCLPCLPPLLRRERGIVPRVEATRSEDRKLRRLSREPRELGPAPPRETLYVDIPLGSERPAKAMTGIFVPNRFELRSDGTVDLILYLHGHKKGMAGFRNSMSIDAYWDAQRLSNMWPLREELNAAHRNVILVAPTLGPSSNTGLLTKGGGLDWYLGQVLEALRTYGNLGRIAGSLSLRHLILAAHSGGGAPMRALARSGERMAANIRECWGFDAMYSSDGPKEWAQWAREHPGDKLFQYYRDIDHRPRTYGQKLAAKNLDNVTVQTSRTNNHFRVVKERWRERIRGAVFLDSNLPQVF